MAIDETIAKLQEEIHSKEQKIKELEKAKEKQTDINLNFSEVIKVLKIIVPNHDRTSCSDSKPDNYNTCTRCTILTMASYGMWDDNYVLNISIDTIME